MVVAHRQCFSNASSPAAEAFLWSTWITLAVASQRGVTIRLQGLITRQVHVGAGG